MRTTPRGGSRTQPSAPRGRRRPVTDRPPPDQRPLGRVASDVPRTLLVTNDFPPRPGGIQAYLHALASRLPADELVVYAPAWPGAAASDAAPPSRCTATHGAHAARCPPSPAARSRWPASTAATTVWFGAAAPLALLAPDLRRQAGVPTVLASAHGHEVGWSLLPGARQALRRIGARRRRRSPRSPATCAPGSRRRSDRTPHWSTCRPASTPRCSGPTRRPRRAAPPLSPRRPPVVACVARLVRARARTC